MTLHELAGLLDSLRSGFGENLVGKTRTAFEEASAALRAEPDEALKTFFATHRKLQAAAEHAKDKDARKKEQAEAKAAQKAEADAQKAAGKAEKDRAKAMAAAEKAQQKSRGDVNALAERARNISTLGEGERGMLTEDIAQLPDPKVKQLAKLLGFKPKGSMSRDELQAMILGGPAEVAAPSASEPQTESPAPEVDAAAVDRGVELFQRLRDDASLSIETIRHDFAAFSDMPKPVIDGIGSRLDYLTRGSKDEVLAGWLSMLEDLHLNRRREEGIMQTEAEPPAAPQ